MSARAVRVGRARVDCLSLEEAVDAVCALADSVGRAFVVTPNIQHVALLERNDDFAAAYSAAALVLPDGWPVVLASRALGGGARGRVTGADLLPAVCGAAAERGLTIGILGGRPGAAAEAAQRLSRRYAGLVVCLVEPAPVGFEKSQATLDTVLDQVARADPDVLFVALGAPKGELFLHRHSDRLGSGVAVSVGAAVDFAAGHVRRSPRVLRRLGLEWLWRVFHEPRRLLGRYAHAAPVFLRVVLPDVLRARLRRASSGG